MIQNSIWLGGVTCCTLFQDTLHDDTLIVTNGYEGFILKMSQDSCSHMRISIDSVLSVNCTHSGMIYCHTIGNPSYSYSWENGPFSSDSSHQVSLPGNYSLTVKGGNGCEKEKTIHVNGLFPDQISNFDLRTGYNSTSFVVPGTSTTVSPFLINQGCIPVSGNFYVKTDPLSSFNHSVPPPDSITNDTLIWSFNNLIYDSLLISPIIHVDISNTAQLGDTLHFPIWTDHLAGDTDSLNNSVTYSPVVISSFDPNLIQAFPEGECEPHFVPIDQTLTYTIHFQNTGNASATKVKILDTMNIYLDLTSLNILDHSHSMITEISGDNVIGFIFENINLPDSNSNEQASHGYVTYEISPLSAVPEYTFIVNTGYIYFDYNVPVKTNTVYHTLVSSVSNCNLSTHDKIDDLEIHVYPNPAKDILTIVQGSNSKLSIEILDIEGRLIQSFTSSEKNIQTDVSGFANGMYFISVKSEIGNAVHKLVKE